VGDRLAPVPSPTPRRARLLPRGGVLTHAAFATILFGTALLAAGLLLSIAATSARADLGGVPASVHALTGAWIVTEPGARPFDGTLVIRDGRIEMIGTGVEIPTDARVHALPGRTIYPGLIEAYLRVPAPADARDDVPGAGNDTGDPGVDHPNPYVRSALRAVDLIPLNPGLRDAMRRAGFTTARLAPDRGVFRGSSAIVSLADGSGADAVIASDAGHVLAFEHGDWGDRRYPNSLMGAIALARQTLLDVDWHREAWRAWRADPTGDERPAEHRSLRALEPVLDGRQPLLLESEDVFMLPRALAIAREFGLTPVLVSGGSDEYRWRDRVKRWLEEAGASLVVTVDFPAAPVWAADDGDVNVELDELLHWERAPANLAVLEAEGIPFAVSTQGLEDRADVRTRLREAIGRGLSRSTALASLTTEPARHLGIDDRTGTIEPGKAANLLVTTGDLFVRGTEIEEVWIEGVRYGDDPIRATVDDVKGEWQLEVGAGVAADTVRIVLETKDGALKGRLGVRPAPDPAGSDSVRTGSAEDTVPERKPGEEPPLGDLTLVRGRLSFTIPSGPGRPGETFVAAERDGPLLIGEAFGASGPGRTVVGRRVPAGVEPPPFEETAVGSDPWPPVYDPASAPDALFVRGATIWTCGPDGVVEGGDLHVSGGRIRRVGVDLPVPEGSTVLDATGLHVTPGLIDSHSHSSISGGTSEATNACTAEVRIADVIDPDSDAIYRELAGGLTIEHLLHGSTNVIGGQDAVIKLKWGGTAEDLLLGRAPSGIKFALGENVKKSYWDESAEPRYPQTRLGVDQLLRERFHAAEEYRRDWERWRAERKGVRPRQVLQLDALLEVLDGARLVHCHAYRADEMIMMMRVAEDFGFRVGTFEHALEAYKIANEIARHGAGASVFSDWWSYKFEVIDAIPYNGEILWRRGVRTSFNSDSSELSRRLNLEAAKAVKYGGVPEEDALAFVTIHPATMLGVDHRVGSLEPGKDADFVIWSDHPLSDRAVCRETWIEGVRHFSRDDDLARRGAATELRRRLLAQADRWREIESRDEERDPSRGALGRLWGPEEAATGARLARGRSVAEAGSSGNGVR
jgi:N-acetylglucosamine-6-phosphate deacetylase